MSTEQFDPVWLKRYNFTFEYAHGSCFSVIYKLNTILYVILHARNNIKGYRMFQEDSQKVNY